MAMVAMYSWTAHIPMAKIADASPRATSFRRLRTPSMHATHASCSRASRVLVQMPHTTGLTVRGTYKHRLRRSFYAGQRSQRTEVLPADRWSCYSLFRQDQKKVRSVPSCSVKLTDRLI